MIFIRLCVFFFCIYEMHWSLSLALCVSAGVKKEKNTHERGRNTRNSNFLTDQKNGKMEGRRIQIAFDKCALRFGSHKNEGKKSLKKHSVWRFISVLSLRLMFA